jgi:hypothetical protein
MGVESMFPKRLSRTVVYENPWVNLYVDKVIFPDGRLIEKHHIYTMIGNLLALL